MSRCILLVDDDPVALDALSTALRSWFPDIEIGLCVSAQRACEAVRFFDYDLVISDVRMPEMDGTTLLARIRDIRPTLPVLLVTGHDDEGLGDVSRTGDGSRLLRKPVDRPTLAAAVEWAFGSPDAPAPSPSPAAI